MPTERELAAKFTTLIAHGQYAGGRYMYTGRLTATGVTLDGAAINKVWVRAEEDSREETQVWGSAQRINLRVWVQPNAAGELMITEPDYSASAYSGQEGVAGSLMPAITPENNPNLLIGGRQFRPGRMRTSALGGLYVYVEPFHYDGGFWPGGDFLMTVPSTASMQAWCAVAMNPADDTLYQFTGTEYALPYLLTEVELGNLSVTPGYIPVGAVVLYNGQTTITGAERWADFHYHFAQAGSAISGFVTLTPDSDTRNTVQPSGDHPAIIVKNNASQTDNPFQTQTSAGAVNVSIAPLGGLTVNEQGADSDTRIEGDTNANLLFVDAGADRVGIGTASPAQLLDVNGTAIIQTLMTDASTELTLATGAITVTQTFHRVDTEADAASDDLATINGGADGQFLVIRAENAGREVVVTTAGNITTSDGNNVALDEVYKFLLLIYDGNRSKWNVVGGGGGGGAYYQTVKDNGSAQTQRSAVNFHAGSNVTITIADDSGNDETDVTIAASGSAGSGTCDGRLTLTSGVPVTTSDVTAAATLYFTPYKGNQIGLYNGAAWEEIEFTEKSIKLTDTQTGTLNTTTTVTALTDTSQFVVGMQVTGANIPAETTISTVDSATQITLSAAATGSGATALTFKLRQHQAFDVFGYLNAGDLKLEFLQWTAGSTGAITGCTNANPPVATVAVGHGLSIDDVVTIHNVVGSTGINGTFRISATTATTITLVTLANANPGAPGAYTSGGRWFKENYAGSRATALVLQDGTEVKTGATTRKYLGTIRVGRTAGQANDSKIFGFVWNRYNRVRKEKYNEDPTGHTYNVAAERAWNNDFTYRAHIIMGLSEYTSDLVITGQVRASVNGSFGYAAVGANSVVGLSNSAFLSANDQAIRAARVRQSTFSVGYTYLQLIEYGDANAVTFTFVAIGLTWEC